MLTAGYAILSGMSTISLIFLPMRKSLQYVFVPALCLLVSPLLVKTQMQPTPTTTPYDFKKLVDPSILTPQRVKQADALVQKGDFDAAITLLDLAIRMDPRSAEAYQQRGIAYGEKADNDKAIADLTKAIELVPKDDYSYYLRGTLYNSIKDRERAMKDLNDAIRLNSGVSLNYFGRGQIFAVLADYDKAIADYTAALKLDPESEYAYYYRGTAYAAAGRDSLAIQDIRSAVKLAPQNDSYKQTLATLEKRHGGSQPSGASSDTKYSDAVAEIDRLLAAYDKDLASYKEGIAAKDQTAPMQAMLNCSYYNNSGSDLENIGKAIDKMAADNLPKYQKGIDEFQKRKNERKMILPPKTCVIV